MNGQAPDLNLNPSTGGTAWNLLAEFSLQEFLSDHRRSDGLRAGFHRPFQELDALPVWVADLEAMLARFAAEMEEHLERGGRVRVFCQKKIIDHGDSERAASPLDHAEQSMEHAQVIPDPGKKMKGGWGYFLIERKGDGSPDYSENACNSIDLYLYKEGE